MWTEMWLFLLQPIIVLMILAIIALGLASSFGFRVGSHAPESEGTFPKDHNCVDPVAPNLTCTEGEKRLQSACHSTEMTLERLYKNLNSYWGYFSPVTLPKILLNNWLLTRTDCRLKSEVCSHCNVCPTKTRQKIISVFLGQEPFNKRVIWWIMFGRTRHKGQFW